MKKFRINKWVKSALAIIVIIFLILTSVMYSFGEQKFKDIEKHWGKQHIENMVGKSILNGYEDNTFKPDAPVSRVEAIVMVTRLFNKKDIDDTYANSKSKYESDLKNNNIPTWAHPQMIFALEKGIINRSLISDFVKNGKQQDASRLEIAICLAKGLDIESELSNNPILTFNDTSKIPKNAVPYVDILIKKGIINGSGDYKGNFNPSNSVTRAEMAKMLSVGYELVNKKQDQPAPDTNTKPDADVITYIEGKVYDITTSGDSVTITILNSRDDKLVFSNKTSTVTVKLGDEISNISNVKKDLTVSLTVSGSKILSIKIKNTEIEKEGYYSNTSFNANGYQTVSFKIDDKYEEYKLESTTKVRLDDSDSNMYNLNKDDKAKLKIINGKLSEIDATSKNGERKGIVKDINSSEITITKDKTNYEYDIKKNVKVERNNKNAKIADIHVGDEVKLTLEYKEVTEIEAESVKEKVKGVLKEIKINSSNTPEITVELDNGDTKTYKLLSGFTVEIDDESAGFYDLRVNYEVELTLESDVVSKIECEESNVVETYIGKILDIDTRDNTIELETKGGKKIYIKYTSSTLIQDSDGRERSEDRLREDDTISVIGEDKLGSINATIITKIN